MKSIAVLASCLLLLATSFPACAQSESLAGAARRADGLEAARARVIADIARAVHDRDPFADQP